MHPGCLLRGLDSRAKKTAPPISCPGRSGRGARLRQRAPRVACAAPRPEARHDLAAVRCARENGHIDRDFLFLATLDDLEKRLRRGLPEYDVLGIAGLLRKLLLDGVPLVDQVNRDRGLKIRYRANVRKPTWMLAGTSPPPVFWSREDGFDPDSVQTPVEVAELTRDQLLSQVVMTFQGHELTVKDVVLHAANVGGAVHAGRPRDEKQRALSALAEQMHWGGYSTGVGILLAIGRVVLRGLRPLRERVALDVGRREEFLQNTSERPQSGQ